MLEGIEAVRWDLELRPSWSGEGEVVRALRALAEAASETAGQTAYSRVLFALGNNHAGTYYPVVLAALPFLAEILRDGGLQARLRTCDVLIDLLASFAPEPGYEVTGTPSGERAVQHVLRERALELVEDVERLASGSQSSDERRLATELLRALRE